VERHTSRTTGAQVNATPLLAASGTAQQVSEFVKDAIAGDSSPLRISGRGLWLSAGGPVTAAASVSLADDDAIVAYTPGDLSITAQAGASLSQIDAVAREHNQWLPLDPFGARTGTIGATIATASYGPLAQMFGTPRDQVLGVEFVTGSGDIVRGGGRVTKNVAGFDLTRLLCGSWGTLGIITEVTMRLRGLPEADQEMILGELELKQRYNDYVREVRQEQLYQQLKVNRLNLLQRVLMGLDDLLHDDWTTFRSQKLFLNRF
jgi:FAD/FMN-containing dehydrogenase